MTPSKKKASTWHEWTEKGSIIKFMGKNIDPVIAECQSFDIRHPNGAVIIGTVLQHSCKESVIRGCLAHSHTLYAVHPDGWTVIVPRKAKLRISEKTDK